MKKIPADKSVRVQDFDLKSSAGHLLRLCHQQSRNIYEKTMGHTGLSRQQIALMISMYQNPCVTHSQLSDASGFERNTLAEMIDRLIKADLATRRRSPRDGRAYEVALTAKGQKLLEDHIVDIEEIQQKITASLPKGMRRDFLRCLRLIAQCEGK